MPTQVETLKIPLGTTVTIPAYIEHVRPYSIAGDGVNIWIDSVTATYTYEFPEPFSGAYPFDLYFNINGVGIAVPGIANAGDIDTFFTGNGFSIIGPFKYEIIGSRVYFGVLSFDNGVDPIEAYDPEISDSSPLGNFNDWEEGGYLYFPLNQELYEIKFIDKANDVVVNPPTGLATENKVGSFSHKSPFAYIPRSHIRNVKIFPVIVPTSDIKVNKVVIPFSTDGRIKEVEYGTSEEGPMRKPIGPFIIETDLDSITVVVLS